jgi:hypothetical protein
LCHINFIRETTVPHALLDPVVTQSQTITTGDCVGSVVPL